MDGSKRARHVRLLTDRDAVAYRRLRMASVEESPEFACTGIVRELTLYARGWPGVPSIHTLEGGRVWGAHDADVLVGAICVSRYPTREGAEFHLWGLYVNAGHRGSHAAAALVRTALQWCRQQRGARAVRAHLRRDDRRAQRWCMRKGFEAVEDPALVSTRLRAMRLGLEAWGRESRGESMCWGKNAGGSSRVSGEQELRIRRLTRADAQAYYVLRVRSCADHDPSAIPEVRVLDELDAGSEGMADLLEHYDHEGTSVWGVLDRDVLAGVLCLSWRIGIEAPDEALVWGIQVLPRYRGTAVSRLLMESAVKWCVGNPIRWMTASVERDNVHACQYLERFGFERVTVADGGQEDSGSSVVRMRRRIG